MFGVLWCGEEPLAEASGRGATTASSLIVQLGHPAKVFVMLQNETMAVLEYTYTQRANVSCAMTTLFRV